MTTVKISVTPYGCNFRGANFLSCLCCSQNTEMWRDFDKVTDVELAARVWLLTLEKQGCSTMLQAG